MAIEFDDYAEAQRTELEVKLCEALRTGQSRLAEKTWTQGVYKSEKYDVATKQYNDAYCLLGACGMPYMDTRLDDKIHGALADAIDQSGFDRLGKGVAAWNDSPSRVFADVKKVIDKAVELSCK